MDGSVLTGTEGFSYVNEAAVQRILILIKEQIILPKLKSYCTFHKKGIKKHSIQASFYNWVYHI